jgi:lipoprotein NlpI
LIYRGDDLRSLGRYDEAEQDYAAAGRLDPDNMQLLYSRGMLEFYRGRYQGARKDLDRWLQLFRSGRSGENLAQPEYVILWRHLTALKMGISDRREMHHTASGFDHSRWPYPILAYFLGSIGKDQLLAMAASGKLASNRAQSCEAYAYIGARELADGNAAGSRHDFDIASKVCPPNFVEKELAVHELRSEDEPQ